MPSAASRCLIPGLALVTLLAGMAATPPSRAADAPRTEPAPIRFEAGTARHRKALAGTAAEGLAEGDFVVARIDFDGDGRDETVVQGRNRLWCSEAGCSTMVLKNGGARPAVLLDANLPRTLGTTRSATGRHGAIVGLDGNGRIAIGDRVHGRLYGRPLVFPLRGER